MAASKKRAPALAPGVLAKPGAAPSRSTPVEDLPRPAPVQAAPAAPERAAAAGGIKNATVGTTVYLLPAEHKRVKRLALDLDVPSVHELMLLGLDRIFAEQGQPPLRRYMNPTAAPRRKKG